MLISVAGITIQSVGSRIEAGTLAPIACFQAVDTTLIFLKGVFTGIVMVGLMVLLVCAYFMIQRRKEQLVDELALYNYGGDLEETTEEPDE
jgi:hypothetical protein